MGHRHGAPMPYPTWEDMYYEEMYGYPQPSGYPNPYDPAGSYEQEGHWVPPGMSFVRNNGGAHSRVATLIQPSFQIMKHPGTKI